MKAVLRCHDAYELLNFSLPVWSRTMDLHTHPSVVFFYSYSLSPSSITIDVPDVISTASVCILVQTQMTQTFHQGLTRASSRVCRVLSLWPNVSITSKTPSNVRHVVVSLYLLSPFVILP